MFTTIYGLHFFPGITHKQKFWILLISIFVTFKLNIENYFRSISLKRWSTTDNKKGSHFVYLFNYPMYPVGWPFYLINDFPDLRIYLHYHEYTHWILTPIYINWTFLLSLFLNLIVRNLNSMRNPNVTYSEIFPVCLLWIYQFLNFYIWYFCIVVKHFYYILIPFQLHND